MKRPITAKSWSDLLKQLYPRHVDSHINRYRSSFAYRGVDDSGWPMETSLMRLGGPYHTLERHLLRNFRKYAHREVADRDSFWYWLAIAQHHGLPTRLLDWTSSPLVALHFATADLSLMGNDGAVWCVDIPQSHSILPDVLLAALKEEGSYYFTVDMLARMETKGAKLSLFGLEATIGKRDVVLSSLEQFDKLSPQPFPLFFEPPSIDDRIVNQYALFSVMSSPKARLDQWLETRPAIYKKIVIPAKLKWEVRDKLDQSNLNERVLFPGLDGLSKWLKRYYKPVK